MQEFGVLPANGSAAVAEVRLRRGDHRSTGLDTSQPGRRKARGARGGKTAVTLAHAEDVAAVLQLVEPDGSRPLQQAAAAERLQPVVVRCEPVEIHGRCQTHPATSAPAA